MNAEMWATNGTSVGKEVFARLSHGMLFIIPQPPKCKNHLRTKAFNYTAWLLKVKIY